MLATTGAAAIEYNQTVDIVEAGADPTGGEPIDDVFHDVAQNGTLVEFPEGEYAINHLSLYALENFGMRSTGDATLVPGSNYDDDVWIGGGDLRNVLVEGFTIDSTEEGVAPSVVLAALDGLIVRDVLKRGPQSGGNTAFDLRVTEADGSGLVERVRVPDGDTGENGTAVGFYINTTGTLTVRDCRIEEFTNNGLYGSGSTGPVQVEGGFYKNNDVANIRLGSDGSYVKSADVVVSDPRYDDGNYRGIRVSDGPGPVIIEDVDIRLESGQGSGGVACAYDGGSFELRNSRIYVGADYSIVGTDDVSGHAVTVDDASGIDDPGERTIQNLSVTGDAHRYTALRFRRDNNTVEGAQIRQTGEDQNGVLIESGSTNNVVRDCGIEVTGDQVANNGEAVVENVSDEANPEKAVVSQEAAESDDGGTSDDGSGDTATPTQTETESDTATRTPTDTDTAAQTATDTATQARTRTQTPTDTDTDTDTGGGPQAQSDESTSEPTAATSDATDEAADRAQYPVASPENDTYATTATTDDAPTVTVWTDFTCPYSTKFARNNFQDIVEKLVQSGDVRVRQRTLPYDYDDPDFPGIDEAKGGVLAAEYALGVWNVEPESYWTFFRTVYGTEGDIDRVTEESMDAFMRAAGVENRDEIHSRVESGAYHAAVERTTEDATEFDINLVPRITFRGDKVAARRDTDVVLEWIRDRL